MRLNNFKRLICLRINQSYTEFPYHFSFGIYAILKYTHSNGSVVKKQIADNVSTSATKDEKLVMIGPMPKFELTTKQRHNQQ
jgi:hypothetical protein